jgi:fatty-acyl-CoA synthase
MGAMALGSRGLATVRQLRDGAATTAPSSLANGTPHCGTARRIRGPVFERLASDLTYLRAGLRTLRRTAPIVRNPRRIFPMVIDELAEEHGEKPALLSAGEILSYRALAERSRRYTRWTLQQGIAKGDVIALLMPNRPEYFAIWLGLTRAGATVALLNTRLSGASLAYCIDIVAARHVIVAAECAAALDSTEGFRKTSPKVWLHGDPGAQAGSRPHIDLAVATLDGKPLVAAEELDLTIEDKALFIYTSGTTGMPKAANINHYRLMLAAYGFSGVMDTRADDRMYDCLPMHHTAGGVVAIGATLVVGGSVYIRDRFSAREFWDEVVTNECTLFQYIGELCRYLTEAPPHPRERAHRLRLAIGNGLRPEVWPRFAARFAVPRIREFYAATEGNVNLFNFDGRLGAVGRIPWFLKHRFPIAVVRFDMQRRRPLRNAEGLCERAAPGEIGEAVGQILSDRTKSNMRFEGYADTADNAPKILRDVFTKGDAWFRSGDLMREDADGYFYFIDRIGDTFRWKGENVSTMEVAEIVGSFPGIHEANVYGVAVAGREGRAGMAAIVCAPGLDLVALRGYLAARLPDYARPLFLRVCESIEVTATFKQKKIGLAKEGFDPDGTTDEMFFDDPREGAYVRLDGALYREIVTGRVRL